MTPLEYAWKLINEKEEMMDDYKVEVINPNIAYLVTLDDKPLQTSNGQPLLFYRRKDAARFVAERLEGDKEKA
jgi:hypothetical protein